MKKVFKISISTLLAVAFFAMPVFGLEVNPLHYKELQGKDRIETAVMISKEAYTTTAQTVVIASSENFPDALSGGPLSSLAKGPLLLTKASGLPEDVRNEIGRLKPSEILILGGYGSVGQVVENQLAGLASRVRRIYGPDRYQTSIEVAKEVRRLAPKTTESIITSGKVFADALSAGALGSKMEAPLILSDGNSLPAGYEQVMNIGNTGNVIVGGQSSVNIPNLAGERVSGKDRYETSVSLAEKYFPTSSQVILASGITYPDGLSSVSLYNKYQAPILLSKNNSISDGVLKYIENKKVKKGFVIGGINSINSTVRSKFKEKIDDNLFALARPLIDESVSDGDSSVHVKLPEKSDEHGLVEIYRVDSNNNITTKKIGTGNYIKDAKKGHGFYVTLSEVLKQGEKIVARRVEGDKVSDYSAICVVDKSFINAQNEFKKIKLKSLIEIELTSEDSAISDKVKKQIIDKLSADSNLSKEYKYSVDEVIDAGNIAGSRPNEYRDIKIKLTVTNKNNPADKYSDKLENVRVKIVYNEVTNINFDKSSYVGVKGDRQGTGIVAEPVVNGSISTKRLTFRLLDNTDRTTKLTQESFSVSSGKSSVKLLIGANEESEKLRIVAEYKEASVVKRSKEVEVFVRDNEVTNFDIKAQSGYSLTSSGGDYLLQLSSGQDKNFYLDIGLLGKGVLDVKDDNINNFDISTSEIRVSSGSFANTDIEFSKSVQNKKLRLSVTDKIEAKPHEYSFVVKYNDAGVLVSKLIKVKVI